jgi:hypothetical protein
LHSLIPAAITTGQEAQLLLLTRTDPLAHTHRYTKRAAIAETEQGLKTASQQPGLTGKSS